jgi:multiple sugar transport system permease protein
MAGSVYYGLTDWDGFTEKYIGFKNYIDVFTSTDFGRVIFNNIIILACVPIAVFASLFIGNALRDLPGAGPIRNIIFLPTVFSWVIIGIAAHQVFAKNGAINWVLTHIGLKMIAINWFDNSWSALTVLCITFVWAMIGPNMIILMSGYATLDTSLEDAARVDGARNVQVFVHITIPLMRRFLVFALIFTIIFAFTNIFSLIYVMTGGGPGYSTTTLEYYIYRQAFNVGNFGRASSLGVVLLVFMALGGWLVTRFARGSEA